MSPSNDPSTFRSLHRLVEHYTPSGRLGRSLFTCVGVTVAMLWLFVVASGFTSDAPLGALTGFVGLLGLVATAFVTVVAAWPVYLSLIGNIDSPAAYGTGVSGDGPAADAETPTAVLKRRYAAGEIDHDEFERRLDRVVDERPSGSAAATERGERAGGESGSRSDRRESERAR